MQSAPSGQPATHLSSSTHPSSAVHASSRGSVGAVRPGRAPSSGGSCRAGAAAGSLLPQAEERQANVTTNDRANDPGRMAARWTAKAPLCRAAPESSTDTIGAVDLDRRIAPVRPIGYGDSSAPQTILAVVRESATRAAVAARHAPSRTRQVTYDTAARSNLPQRLPVPPLDASPQLREGFDLDLSDALSRQIEPIADLLEGVLGSLTDAESHS